MSLRSFATFCYRRRRLVVAFWVAALIGVNVLSSTIGTNFTTNFSAPNTESTQAANLLHGELQGPGRRQRAGRHAGHPLDDRPRRRGAGQGVHRRVRARSPTSSRSAIRSTTPGGISKSGTVALANAQLDAQVAGHLQRRRQADDRAGRAALDAPAPGAPRRSAHPAVRAGPAAVERAASASGRGHHHPAHRLRLGAGHGPADRRRAGRHRGRPPDHRSADPRLSAPELLDHVGHDDRHRRGHRLRVVRRHPLPPRPSVGPRSRGGGRHRHRHVGPSRAVRRPHRDHRPARHAGHRPVVHQRPRHRLRGRRGGHRGCGRDPAAGGARVLRHQHRQAAPAVGPRRGGQHPRDDVAPLEPVRPAPPLGAHHRRPGAWCWRWPCRCCRCDSGSSTPATTRPARRHARPTTCWPKVSGPGSTDRSCWPSRCRRAPTTPPDLAKLAGRRRRRRPTSPRPRPPIMQPGRHHRGHARVPDHLAAGQATTDLLHRLRERRHPRRHRGHRASRCYVGGFTAVTDDFANAARASGCRSSSASSSCSASCC